MYDKVSEAIEQFIDAVQNGYKQKYPEGSYAFSLGYYSSFSTRMLYKYIPTERRDEFIREMEEQIKSLKTSGVFNSGDE